jgi:hypothetical protein
MALNKQVIKHKQNNDAALRKGLMLARWAFGLGVVSVAVGADLSYFALIKAEAGRRDILFAIAFLVTVGGCIGAYVMEQKALRMVPESVWNRMFPAFG